MALPFARSVAQTRPTFSRDFAGLKTLDHGAGPAITFTRASNATYFNAAGTLTTATTNEPRFDHDPATGASRGLLIEEARTNSLRNSQATGAVAGSAGTSPTHWTIAASGSGLTREIVGTGTEDGLPYIDIRYSGTGSGDPIIQITPETTTGTVSAVGQTWTASYYLRLVAGSTSGITSFATVWQERGATGTSLTTVSTNTFSEPTSAALKTNRISVVRTLTDASAVRLTNRLQIQCANSAIDITLRVGAPQLEQGAFPTSYIPTTTATATRSADSAVVTPVSSFYNQSEGTIFCESATTALVAGDNQGIWGVGDNTLSFSAANTIYAVNAPGVAHRITANAFVLGASQLPSLNNESVAQSANTFARSAIVYKQDDYAISTNGSSVATDTLGEVPPMPTGFSIGSLDRAWAGASAHLNGWIKKFAYWPKRLSNTLLQSLTA